MAGTKSRTLRKTLSVDADGYLHVSDDNDAAPADADVVESSFVIWFDDTNDALKVKAKKANGTVVNGTLASLT